MSIAPDLWPRLRVLLEQVAAVEKITLSETHGVVIAVLRESRWASINFNIKDNYTTAELSVDGLHNHIAAETFPTTDWMAFVGYIGFVSAVWRRIQTQSQRLVLFYRARGACDLGAGVRVQSGALLELRYTPEVGYKACLTTTDGKHPKMENLQSSVARGRLSEVVARVEDEDGGVIAQ